MCDIWFTKTDNPNPGGYAAYMPVDITDDGIYETCVEKYQFYVIKFPGVPRSNTQIQKYLTPHPDGEIRRTWVLRGTDLPSAVRNKMQTYGYITVKVGTYDGAYDYTWEQVKNYFHNNITGLDETENL